MQHLTALIQRLTEDLEESGTWSLTPEETARLLDVDPVTFWRTMHGARDRIGYADAIDGWTQDTIGDLVTVLEGLCGNGVEEALARAGLFLPWAAGVGLIEELLFRGRRFAAAHEIQREELESMLRHTGSVRKAMGIYMDAHVDVDSLIDECAESFRVLNDLPAVSAVTAAAWLRRMFTLHVLDRQALMAGLQERLRLAAAQMGFMDPEERARQPGSDGPSRTREPPRRTWARRVMGFSESALTPEALRARYRELMMRHHPDADPAGLEKCKDVNVAYSLLMAETAAR
ncbi:MAG TPA: J domain-containing protein [Spirochaetia bacterium]|nr:J domain-containing protein [Spirochaetia bacterium]